MAIDVAAIRIRGWQQGSLFSIESSRSLLGSDCPPGEFRLILATHDCDILHPGSHEPTVDVFVATPIPRPSSLDMKARNARRLHIPIVVGATVQDHEIKVSSRLSLPRECLSTHSPAEDAVLQDVGFIFREWLGKRYDRAAWPDAFNERLGSRKASQELRAILTPSEHCFRDIYLSIDPEMEEISDGKMPYVVRVAMVMTEPDAGRPDIVRDAERCAQAVNAFLKTCPGIEVSAVEVITDVNFTLADLDSYRPWDFTDLSFHD